MHLGIHPMVTLLDARAKRDEARAQLSDGRDPAVMKRLRIEANLRALPRLNRRQCGAH